MAANTFATMLHRSTHRVVVILVYTLLEWILIALLLLNALFSYLISRFAAFFGLPPPCVFCSRVDHLIDGRGGGESSSISSSDRGFICDAHAAEVSRLGYCSSHRRLAEAGGMCDGCSSSLPSPSGHGRLALLSVVEKEGEVSRCSCCRVELESTGFFSPYLFFKPSWRGVLEYTQTEKSASEKSAETDSDEERNKDEIFREKAGFLEKAKVYPLVSADEDLLEEPAAEDGGDDDDHVIEHAQIAQADGEDEVITAAPSQDLAPPVRQSRDSCCKKEEVDESMEILLQERDFLSNCEHDRLVPVEVIDFSTLTSLDKIRSNGEDEGDLAASEMVVEMEGETADIVIVSLEETVEAPEEVVPPLAPEETDFTRELSSHVASAEEVIDFTNLASLDKLPINGGDEGELGHSQMAVEMEGETADFGIVSLAEIVEAPIEVVLPTVPEENGCTEESSSQAAFAEEREGVLCDPRQIQTIVYDDDDDAGEVVDTVVDCEANPGIAASEDDNKLMDGEANCEVSIGSEICDQEQIYQGALHDELPPLIDLHDYSPEDLNEVPDETQEQIDTIIEVEPIQMMDGGLDQSLASSPDHNEMEEERPTETPSYVEGLHNLHKRFLFDRREPGTESLDGSVASEVDVSDILTVDHLKAALKAERKALSSLYTELEEERSASAIAANQTMAMITRLQEEKAAMQMEALQYQRMMEEQSEYDQEALQLLNELMIKREKEKQDLEKELEVYRKKVLLYEAKERRRLKSAKATGRSETSCASSSAEDSDDLSLELNDSDENFDGLKESNQNTPTDAVLSSGQEVAKHLVTLDESLADFEEERLNIIEQLKALEEKLFTLDDGEHSPVNLEVVGHFPGGNGHGYDGEHESHNSDVNGYVADDLDTNGKHHYEGNNVGFRGKNLLPLFDAISMENEDSSHEQTEEMGLSPGSLLNLNNEQKKLAIAEEVDNVYERLQALEADTEFLKHCLSSLKRGDKGMDLLQEILQHLRDLRSVELRVRNAGDTLASI
ncbi:hypothetical protein Taro_015003 [Colocasia esculenta]|uniref:GTD-binding domain-containing protein n=1 Tax=Colocasia esculenta TaxID=4460 RepID=A0A843UJP4_COLES|nr:hypothetical protein [Colocasia esculenta]